MSGSFSRIPTVAGALALGLLLSACSEAPDVKRIGVFVSSDTGIQELSSFATACRRPVSEMTYELEDEGAMRTTKRIKALYVNLPKADVANTKASWVAHWTIAGGCGNGGRLGLHVKDPSPIALEIASVEGTMYKVSSKDLSAKTDGLILITIPTTVFEEPRTYVLTPMK